MRRLAICIVLTMCCASTHAAKAQMLRNTPLGINDVGIEDRSGKKLPLESTFTDSAGQQVRLGQFFDRVRPVILSFNYASCPLLCKLQLNGLVESLRQLQWTVGKEFQVVSISIDPLETTQQAAVSKQYHVTAYGRADSANGWTFLTGSPESIAAATDATGFRYKFLPKQREFSHTAAAIVCMPDGVISRYLYGVKFEPDTLRLSLTEASAGKIGSPLDQLLLFCFRYDSATGKYAPAAWKLMRFGAITTIIVLTTLIFRYRFTSGKPVTQ